MMHRPPLVPNLLTDCGSQIKPVVGWRGGQLEMKKNREE